MKKRPTPEGKPSAWTASNSNAPLAAWLLAAVIVALLGEVAR